MSAVKNVRYLQRWVIPALVMVGLLLLGKGLYIHAKARLAQLLIAHAWSASRESSAPVRPWPWADTYPVARLRAPAQGIDLYVLEGDSGRSLAFGPGHMTRTPLPGQPGNAVLSAHRDTHFAFLQKLKIGDEIDIEVPDARTRRYRVRDLSVVNQSNIAITADTREPLLTLVTCYPFDAIVPGGPLRYVATAEALTTEPKLAAHAGKLGSKDGK